MGRGLVEEVYTTITQIVDSSTDKYLAVLLQLLEYLALSANLCYGMAYIVVGNLVYESFFVRLTARAFALLNGWVELVQQLCEAPESHPVDSPLDGATVLVPEYEDEFGSRDLAGVLHAADHVGSGDIACYTPDEDISHTLIENILYRHTTVDAPENKSLGVLTTGCLSNCFGMIAYGVLETAEAVIASNKVIKHSLRS